MKLMLSFIVAVSALFFVGGCGCGDRLSYRQIEITEVGMGYFSPIEVDTSQIEQYEQPTRSESKDSCSCPETIMRINPKYPIKIIIVPSTQPTRR